jgi:hypothetical protein
MRRRRTLSARCASFWPAICATCTGAVTRGAIERASAVLVRRLEANPPRVSPAQRERRPEIVEIGARRPRSDRVQLVATIDAGETSQYPIGALLVKQGGRWTVSEILNDE